MSDFGARLSKVGTTLSGLLALAFIIVLYLGRYYDIQGILYIYRCHDVVDAIEYATLGLTPMDSLNLNKPCETAIAEKSPRVAFYLELIDTHDDVDPEISAKLDNSGEFPFNKDGVFNCLVTEMGSPLAGTFVRELECSFMNSDKFGIGTVCSTRSSLSRTSEKQTLWIHDRLGSRWAISLGCEICNEINPSKWCRKP